MSSLVLQNISKSFGSNQVLENINLQINTGEFVVLVGPSGCGKSTLLQIISGLEPQDTGHVIIDGQSIDDVPPAKRGISMVFQSYALYPHHDVEGNLTLGVKNANIPKKEIAARLARTLKMLELGPYLARRPAALSGGQRQRVAIGRAIMNEPKIFLFDEPLSNLDAALRLQTRIQIAELHNALKTTSIYVTHDQSEAMTLASKIAILNEGRIEQIGTPLMLYNHPRNLFVAGFLGSPAMNFLEKSLPLPDGIKTLGIRAEHLYLAQNGKLCGEVFYIEHHGSHAYLYMRTSKGESVVSKHEGQTCIQIHQRISLDFDLAHCYYFDVNGISQT